MQITPFTAFGLTLFSSATKPSVLISVTILLAFLMPNLVQLLFVVPRNRIFISNKKHFPGSCFSAFILFLVCMGQKLPLMAQKKKLARRKLFIFSCLQNNMSKRLEPYSAINHAPSSVKLPIFAHGVFHFS